MSETFYEAENGAVALTAFCRSANAMPDRRGVQITGFQDERLSARSYVCMSVPDAIRLAQEILRRYPEEAGCIAHKHIAEYSEKIARLKLKACATADIVAEMAELVSEL